MVLLCVSIAAVAMSLPGADLSAMMPEVAEMVATPVAEIVKG